MYEDECRRGMVQAGCSFDLHRVVRSARWVTKHLSPHFDEVQIYYGVLCNCTAIDDRMSCQISNALTISLQ